MGGGAIHLESELGKGSKFSFILPFQFDPLDQAKPSQGLSAPRPPPDPLPKSGLRSRLLLVEDNQVNQKLVLKILERLGVKGVDCASNGKEAAESYQPGVHGIVFMDCQMPVMDGYESTRAIRRIEAELGVSPAKIFAMTANNLEEDRRRCLEAGMDGYISKPISKARVADCLGILAPPPPPVNLP